jgi:hypothetical protein
MDSEILAITGKETEEEGEDSKPRRPKPSCSKPRF